MTDFQNTQQALSDIQVLRQAILRSKNKLALTVDSVDTHLVLNTGALAIAAGVGIAELGWPQVTDALIFSAKSPDTRLIGLGFIAVTLISLLTVAYGYLGIRARKEKTTLKDFSDKYFSYFKNLSALSDIFVKFCTFALVILAGKPEWVAPLFVLFIGDLVFQGRLLILSPASSIALGIACFAAAIAMFFAGCISILAPVAVAVVACTWSLINIVRFRSKLLSA